MGITSGSLAPRHSPKLTITGAAVPYTVVLTVYDGSRPSISAESGISIVEGADQVGAGKPSPYATTFTITLP